MNANDISFYYSGGASNSDVALSLGGVKSSEAVAEQSIEPFTNITGITVLEVAGVASGVSTFNYYPSSKTILWKPANGVQSPSVSLSGIGTGVVLLESASGAADGYILLSVVEGSLPATIETDLLTVSTPANTLFNDVTPGESSVGAVRYVCVYLQNNHVSESIAQFFLHISNQLPGADVVSIAVEDAKIGDGSSTGVAISIADSEDSGGALSGLVFVSPHSIDDAVNVLGPIASGESIPVWVKLQVPSLVTDTVLNDLFSLTVSIHQET